MQLRLNLAFLPGMLALIILVGLMSSVGIRVSFPFRPVAAMEFASITVWAEGYPLQYTSFDRTVVEAVQRQLARSSFIHSLSCVLSLLGTAHSSYPAVQPQPPAVSYELRLTTACPPGGGHHRELTLTYQPPTAVPLRQAVVLMAGRVVPASPRLVKLLHPLLTAHESRNRGELVTWELADRLLPRFAVAEVVDVRTGLRYFVQRRAGYRHADVQPLTAHDTQTMLRTFGGEWSWKRRPVLVLSGRRVLAGSINGMPHGAGRIRANTFPGHCCLYFLGSRTHSTDRVDRAHLLAVLRAAGLEVLELQPASTSAANPAGDE